MTVLTDNMRVLLIATASAFNVPSHRLVSPGKEKRITAARRAWFYSLAMYGYSYSEIGKRAGFDHTSVLYAVRKRSRQLYGTSPRARRPEIEKAHRAAQERKAA